MEGGGRKVMLEGEWRGVGERKKKAGGWVQGVVWVEGDGKGAIWRVEGRERGKTVMLEGDGRGDWGGLEGGGRGGVVASKNVYLVILILCLVT